MQQILDRKVKVNKNNKIDLFSGFLKCHDCNNLLFMKKSKGYIYYYCSNYIRDKKCTKHAINRQNLEEKVLKEIKNKHNEITTLDRKKLYELIDIIYISENNEIEIKFKS